LIAASQLKTIGRMKCPRCVQKIHRGAAECPHCGFTLADADTEFGTGEIALRRLTDAAGLFRNHERRRIEAALERFDRRFPDAFAAVYTGTAGGSRYLREFGFWLLNRGVFEDVADDKPNSAAILLVIDPAAKAAGITFGYRLDPYLDQSDTFDCLARAHAWWLEGRHAEGVARVIVQLDALLRRRSRVARWRPGHFARKAGAVAKPATGKECA